MELSYLRTYQDWAEYYKKILNWEIKFDKVADNEFADLLQSQKKKPIFSLPNLLKKITKTGLQIQINRL
jgi:hypothetical protein